MHAQAHFTEGISCLPQGTKPGRQTAGAESNREKSSLGVSKAGAVGIEDWREKGRKDTQLRYPEEGARVCIPLC